MTTLTTLNNAKLTTGNRPVFKPADLNEVTVAGEIIESHDPKYPSIGVSYDKSGNIVTMAKFRLQVRDAQISVTVFPTNENQLLPLQVSKKFRAGDFVQVAGYFENNEGNNGKTYAQVVATNIKPGATRQFPYGIKVSGELVTQPILKRGDGKTESLRFTLSNYADNGYTMRYNNVQVIAWGETAIRLNLEIMKQFVIARELDRRIKKNLYTAAFGPMVNLMDPAMRVAKARPHFTITGNFSTSSFVNKAGIKVYTTQVVVKDFQANPSHELLRAGKQLQGTQGGVSALTATERVAASKKQIVSEQPSGWTIGYVPHLEKKPRWQYIFPEDSQADKADENSVDGTNRPTLQEFASIVKKAESTKPNRFATMEDFVAYADLLLLEAGEHSLLLTPIAEILEASEDALDLEDNAFLSTDGDVIDYTDDDYAEFAF